MNDYLSHLVTRSLSPHASVHPLLLSRFEPPPPEHFGQVVEQRQPLPPTAEIEASVPAQDRLTQLEALWSRTPSSSGLKAAIVPEFHSADATKNSPSREISSEGVGEIGLVRAPLDPFRCEAALPGEMKNVTRFPLDHGTHAAASEILAPSGDVRRTSRRHDPSSKIDVAPAVATVREAPPSIQPASVTTISPRLPAQSGTRSETSAQTLTTSPPREPFEMPATPRIQTSPAPRWPPDSLQNEQPKRAEAILHGSVVPLARPNQGPAPPIVPAATIASPRLLPARDFGPRKTESPSIHVTIGRVEVRATPAPAPAVKAHRREPAGLSLDDYLQRRSRADRE